VFINPEHGGREITHFSIRGHPGAVRPKDEYLNALKKDD